MPAWPELLRFRLSKEKQWQHIYASFITNELSYDLLMQNTTDDREGPHAIFVYKLLNKKLNA